MFAGTKAAMTVLRLREEGYALEELFSKAQMDFDNEDLRIESKYTLEEA